MKKTTTQAVLALMALVNNVAMRQIQDAMSLLPGETNRDDFWEIGNMFGDELYSQAEKRQLRVRRLEPKDGYDLMKAGDFERALELARSCRPRRLWISLPGGAWEKFEPTELDSGKQQDLRNKARRRSRAFMRRVAEFYKAVEEFIKDIHLYWEWPT